MKHGMMGEKKAKKTVSAEKEQIKNEINGVVAKKKKGMMKNDY